MKISVEMDDGTYEEFKKFQEVGKRNLRKRTIEQLLKKEISCYEEEVDYLEHKVRSKEAIVRHLILANIGNVGILTIFSIINGFGISTILFAGAFIIWAIIYLKFMSRS